MNKTYKIQLPRNKEAQNIKTNIKDGTIEVEVELNEKWEPKDGEICYARTSSKLQKFIIIYNHREYSLERGVFNKDKWSLHKYGNWIYSYLRPATDSEKQLLFDALAKEGKMWDAERKQVVDLPRWRAEKGGIHYGIGLDGNVYSVIDAYDYNDNSRYRQGNYFKTKEAAERVAEQIRKIFKNSKAE